MSAVNSHSSQKLFVFHEYGAPSHYKALKHLLESNYPNVELVFVEFSIVRKILSSIKHFNGRLFRKQILNLYRLIIIFFTKDNLVVVGIAPYDFHMVFFNWLARRNKTFYHTSWPRWGEEFYPKKFLAKNRFVINSWERFLEKNILGVFAVTQTAADSLSGLYNIKADISVVSHSISPEMIHKKIEYSDEEKLKILFLGRFEDGKGIKIILNIIRQVSGERFEFSFAGKGRLESQIRDMADQKDNVNCLGFINNPSDVAEIMNSHDVLLLPSLRTETWEEAFGMVIIEAMACGNVVISTDHAGPREIIQNGYDGYVVTERQYQENAIKILSCLDVDRSTMLKIKKRAKEKSENYSMENISKAWDEVLAQYLTYP